MVATDPDPPGGDGDEDSAHATVLVVEDESLIRMMLRSYLERRGYTVLEASDLPGATAHMRAHPRAIDVLITDVTLDGGHRGAEVAAELRAAQPGAPVIYMSAHPRRLVTDQMSEDAVFLRKPFTEEDLMGEILRALGDPEE